MTKTYQSIESMRLVITVEINGGIPVECDFKGGKYYPYRENGTFRTNSKAVQDALEKHERYPGDFKLIKSTEEPKAAEPVKPVETVNVTEKPDLPAETTGEMLPEETTGESTQPENTTKEPKVVVSPPEISADGTVIVSEVTNSQLAKLYLNKNFDVPFSRLKNTEMVMKEAKLANLNFPNWKI